MGACLVKSVTIITEIYELDIKPMNSCWLLWMCTIRARGVHKSPIPGPYLEFKIHCLHERCSQVTHSRIRFGIEQSLFARVVSTNLGFQYDIWNWIVIICTDSRIMFGIEKSFSAREVSTNLQLQDHIWNWKIILCTRAVYKSQIPGSCLWLKTNYLQERCPQITDSRIIFGIEKALFAREVFTTHRVQDHIWSFKVIICTSGVHKS